MPIRDKFVELFNKNPYLFSAPGRINLIGEHTDYNDGFVMPAAIDKRVVFAIALNNIGTFHFFAIDLNQLFETKKIEPALQEFHWANYLLGVLDQFKKKGLATVGIDCVFGSDIPLGAGLSSSAALECGFAYGLNELLNTKLSKYELALMAQKAEHDYAGVMCGIMDQYASMFGKKDHVFRLDCRSHKHQYFPFEMDDFVIALVDTKVKHELASSEYNLRRQECEKGVSVLRQINPSVKALRDVDEAFMVIYKDEFDSLTFRRCNYIVKENQRVLDACEALEKSDFNTFGELMYKSHDGLQYEYEVSCKELDLLVDLTRNMDYVIGSRMMGGGFGGCTINLIQNNKVLEFEQLITKKYQLKTGITPNIYLVKISDGVSSVS